MSIIYAYDKRVDITYAYDSQSYYDPVKKQSRSKRHLVGRVDPNTGEIVPTGKKGQKPRVLDTTEYTPENFAALSEAYDKAKAQLEEKDLRIKSLESEIFTQKKEFESYKRFIEKQTQRILDYPGDEQKQVASHE